MCLYGISVASRIEFFERAVGGHGEVRKSDEKEDSFMYNIFNNIQHVDFSTKIDRI